MDLVCTRCGEPWSLDYVLHDEPEAFERNGGRIDRCPACPKEPPRHSRKQLERLAAVKQLANLLGADVDGLAATLEEFNLL